MLLAMDYEVSKTRTGRSRSKSSGTSQKQLLDAGASTGADAELPPSHREQSQSGDLARDTTPVQAGKRRLDATTESDPVPAKRARLTQTDTQQRVEGEKAEPVDKTTLQQPKPKPPKRPYASFLEDFVDPVHPDRRAVSVHTFVSEWLESVGSDRETHCRSDSHLQRSDGDSIPRQLTRSAPEMGYTQDADGFAVPPTPASTGSRSRRPSSVDNRSQFSATGASGASSPAGVRHRSYRHNNLQLNHIYVQRPSVPLPNAVSGHIDDTLRAERDSPELSADEMKRAMDWLDTLEEGCDEEDVADFLNDTVFPNPKTDTTYGLSTGLASSSGALMYQHLVPNDPAVPFRVTQPKPDRLYGYSEQANQAFTQPQLLAQTMLHPHNPIYPTATAQGLRFPFFVIEFKAAGGTSGDLWVATNQCAGASSACLNAVDQLNNSLPKHSSVQRVDNLSYSVAVDNNTAKLYISWKEDNLNYYLQRVGAFLLSRPEDFKSFRKQVRNILDWGKDTHLTQIKNALDTILEENRMRASEAAKSRQPPSDGSAASSSKRHKPSSRRHSSRSDSVQGQSGETSKPY